jgi:hypothetical protein
MPLDPDWRLYAHELPDARARRSTNEKKHQLLGLMEQVFCVNCGRSGGMVTAEWAKHVFYLCDPCAETHGHLPIPELPESLVRGKDH